ncbi:hypothetical protein [Allokutzneria oryzae]|uniref:Uncharacterized protein n=1 Tax=Allokutzneria oryzae TaxID=1378989 RepID=A0ABV6AAM9_9PSEU
MRMAALPHSVAATSQAEHDNAITHDYPVFSVPTEVIAALS